MEGKKNLNKGDYLSLKKAVNRFNRQIRILRKNESNVVLPEEIDLQEEKERILTKGELKRFINSLNRFNRETAKEYITDAGERISKWEINELNLASKRITKRLNKELDKLYEPNEQGFSRAQMGSMRVNQLNAQIKNINNIENLSGYDFNRLRNRLKNLGRSDYEYKKALIYRENYMNEMEKYSHLENYDKLIEKMNSIKDPFQFYKYVESLENELVEDLTYQSDQYYSQIEFNEFAKEWGVEIENEDVEIENEEFRL